MNKCIVLMLIFLIANTVAFAEGRTTQDIYLFNKSEPGGKSCYIQDSVDSFKKGVPMPAGSNPGHQIKYSDFATKACNRSDQKIHQMNVYCGGELVCIVRTTIHICTDKDTGNGVILDGRAEASRAALLTPLTCAPPTTQLFKKDNNIYFYIPVVTIAKPTM